MTGPIGRWWSSIAFRQALIYGGLVVFTMIVLLAIIYQQTVGTWQRRVDRQLDTTTQRLLEYYEKNGASLLASHINSLLGAGVDSDTEVYTLVGADGHKVAGNLALTPDVITPTCDIIEHRVLRAGRPSQSRLRITHLANGGILVVGRDMQDQHELDHLIRSASLWGAAVTVLVAVGGAFQSAFFNLPLDPQLEPASPRNTTTARFKRTTSASSRRPICLPTLLFATVVILSTMRRDTLFRPLAEVGSIGMRNSSATVGSPVKGQIVTDSVASNLLSCKTATGRGLPA